MREWRNLVKHADMSRLNYRQLSANNEGLNPLIQNKRITEQRMKKCRQFSEFTDKT